MSAHPSARSAPSAGLVQLALALGGFAIGTTEFASMSLLPDFARTLGVDEPTAGHAISAYALGVVVGAPVIAVLAARIARRTLLVGLMVLFAIGNGLSALSPTFETMVIFRFLSGLPHGAYFGVAALVAASLAAPDKRASAVARVMIGLTVATIVGVPLANAVGQWIGWRWGFVIVSALATLTAISVFLLAPREAAPKDASPLRELSALASRRVWLTLGIGAIGFGGMFAVYTYLASTLVEVTHASPSALPLVLMVFGLGMTAGTLVCAWAADRALMPAVGAILLWSVASLALYPLAVGSLWTLVPVVFLIGCGGGLGAALQTRLMDVAGEAQTLAAALNHSAFNTANALGPWLAGMAVASGFGWRSTGWVGCALAAGGFVIWAIAVWDDRRERALAAA
ncbi:MFS transporter [Caulobacter endophyticus]|uniref:MFS transporter n=1 Tax=Caulobacter endophyticus TaxID=2172652 RepID=UPI00240F43E5|nr:MFS transporter [Caulobacter endophyticus]MDG2528900.1 MFS transporter [Caulobacter endophyticus]